MYCKNCGNQLREGANFCAKCGAKVEQQREQQRQPEQKKMPVWAAVLVGCILFAAAMGGTLFFLKWKNPDNNSHRSEEITVQSDLEADDTEKMAADTETDLETESDPQTENENAADTTQSQKVSLEEYANTLPMCNIDGEQYQYDTHFVTQGLRWVEGYLDWKVVDLDSDGEDELLAFYLKTAENGGNTITAEVYENGADGVGLADRVVLVDHVLGSQDDMASMRFMLKDNHAICFDSQCMATINGSDIREDLAMFSYNGSRLECVVTDTETTVDFSDIGITHQSTVQKLREVGLNKSADNLERHDDIAFCSADSGITALAKLYVTNELVADDGLILPVATCHFVKTGDADYVLPQSASSYLTEEDLSGLSKEQLKIARNEIYARYSWSFEDEELKAYFEAKPWYTRYWMKVTDDELTDIEKANRDLIVEAENKSN